MVPRRRDHLVAPLWYPDTPWLRFPYNSTNQNSQISRYHRHPRSNTMSSACYFLVYFLSYLPPRSLIGTFKPSTATRYNSKHSHFNPSRLQPLRFEIFTVDHVSFMEYISASTEFAFRTQPLPLNDTRLTNKCRDYVIVGRVWQKQVNDFVTARWARMYACT